MRNLKLCSLAPLQTFDPKVFQPDSEYSQELCDFILGLALFYNDVKDTMDVIAALRITTPGGDITICREWGEHCGRDMHILRHHVGMLHELFEFIKKHDHIINLTSFQKIIRQMPSKCRKAWAVLVDAAAARPVSGSIGKIFILLRNNLAFHYSSTELGKGYKRHFIRESGQPAFVSLGNSMAETRFYFADAAVEDYILSILGDLDKREFQEQIRMFFNDINTAFYSLVHSFIMKRGTYSAHKSE